MRLDPKSEDSTDIARAREAFYGDLTKDQFATALGHLHPNEPVQVTGVPSPVTKKDFGPIARHSIECAAANAIVVGGLQEIIRIMDAPVEM